MEYLTWKLRPFYIEITAMHHCECCVYPHHPAAKEEAPLAELHDMITKHENMYPDAAVIILGDFNHCNLQKEIPKLHRFVIFPTRRNKILDTILQSSSVAGGSTTKAIYSSTRVKICH